VDKKTFNILVALIVLFIMCSVTIVMNVIRNKKNKIKAGYESNKTFSVKVSESTWDESMMPAGRRSPKGVLYKPEGSIN
jgi:hypothetical protein